MPISGYDFARMVDSTNFVTTATRQDLDLQIKQAKKYHFYSVIGPHCYLPYLAKQLEGSDVNPGSGCTKLSGADPTPAKAFLAKWSVEQGAKEIDMVTNISFFKSGLYKEYVDDIRTVKEAIGDTQLKCILEVALLSDAEIEKAAELALEGGANCIKTGTGVEGPTTIHHVEVLSKALRGRAWIKAAGGIRDVETVDRMIDLGVTRFGINHKSAAELAEIANNR